MGHRHLFNSSQHLETDNEEGRNPPEHPYGGNLPLQLNHPPTSGGVFLSGSLTSEYPQYQPPPQPQPPLPRPTYDPFLHPPASGSSNLPHENYPSSTSSSSIHRGQTRRGSYKRKRYWDTGSSSSVPISTDSKQVADSQSHHPSWDFSSSYVGHGVTFCNEDTSRNVRSRISFGFEGNSSSTHFSPDTTHNPLSNLWGQAPNMLTSEQNHGLINPAHHSRPFVSETPVIMANSNSSASMGLGGYHSFHQNLVPRSVQVNPSQTVRGIRSTYPQRSATGIRASSDEGFPVFSHGYGGRHSRSHPTSGPRDRSGRPRMSVDRFRAPLDDVVVHNHHTREGLVIVDHSALHGSRTHFDQHRDMRLDIDSMTYEDLLALGERIGNVNTGVSEDLISKCLTESIFCSSNQPQEAGRCVICLKKYKKMDNVGTLKLCGHEFHVECIRKWLAVKNNCPICKCWFS